MSYFVQVHLGIEATCQIRQYEPVKISVAAIVQLVPGSSPEQETADAMIRLRGMLAQQFRELEQPAAARTAEMLETTS